MNIVLLQTRLSLQEIDGLLKEFPQYLFLSLSETQYRNLTKEYWANTEVIFGAKLTVEGLQAAHSLRWVHAPGPFLNQLCMAEIEQRNNVIVTNTRDENVEQIAEYVLAGVLLFAKNMLRWEHASQHPSLVWDSRWRDDMWTLKGKTFLQVGLDKIGTEIARLAHNMKMRVWGMRDRRSFHPYCDKTFSFKELHSLLPAVDVISICLPRSSDYLNMFRLEELQLLKEDAIMVIIGSNGIVNEEELVAVMKEGKLRGVLFDSLHQTPVSSSSKMWAVPNLIITPEVAPRPKMLQGHAFRLFRYNLRQYLHGNFNDMKNIVNVKH